MNCFEFRRRILANPREKTREQEQHMSECAACANLAKEMESFEASIHDAVLVPVPEALAERVLLRHKIRSPGRLGVWALAASLIVALAVVIQLYHGAADDENRVVAAAALGDNHPAVAAISYVLDHEPQLLKEGLSGDPAVMRSALSRLGLTLPAGGITVRYLGKCPVVGGTGEHVVLQTPFGHVTLILVPDQMFTRVVVADRYMTAVASATRTGGSYILVSDSLASVKRVEKMLM